MNISKYLWGQLLFLSRYRKKYHDHFLLWLHEFSVSFKVLLREELRENISAISDWAFWLNTMLVKRRAFLMPTFPIKIYTLRHVSLGDNGKGQSRLITCNHKVKSGVHRWPILKSEPFCGEKWCVLLFTKVGMLYQNLLWLGHSGVSCGWRRDVPCHFAH